VPLIGILIMMLGLCLVMVAGYTIYRIIEGWIK
jgi:hypothetical protein